MDYLNEVLTVYRRRRGDGTYENAARLKRQGGAIIFNLLIKEWMSRFKWKTKDKNDAIATEFIERAILFDGIAAFKKMSNADLLENSTFSLPTELKNNMTRYEEKKWRLFRVTGADYTGFYPRPNSVTLVDFAGRTYGNALVAQQGDELNELLGDSLAVVVADSATYEPGIARVLYYAEKMNVIETSINACIRNIMGTTIISCPKEQEKQILKERRAASIGIPWVIRYDGIYKTGEQMQILTTPGSPEALKTLYEAFNKTHADFLQSIGIRANNEVDKKTGVNPLELIQSRQNVDIILNNAFEMRKRAIDQLNVLGYDGLDVNLENFEALIADYDAKGNRIDDPHHAAVIEGDDYLEDVHKKESEV